MNETEQTCDSRWSVFWSKRALARSSHTRNFQWYNQKSFTIYPHTQTHGRIHTHDVKHRSHILNNAHQPTHRPTDCVYCIAAKAVECDFVLLLSLFRCWKHLVCYEFDQFYTINRVNDTLFVKRQNSYYVVCWPRDCCSIDFFVDGASSWNVISSDSFFLNPVLYAAFLIFGNHFVIVH